MGAEHQKAEDTESNKLSASITAILGRDRKWAIVYEGIEHSGSIILGHPESTVAEMIAALEFAAGLLRYGKPYIGKEGEVRIANRSSN